MSTAAYSDGIGAAEAAGATARPRYTSMVAFAFALAVLSAQRFTLPPLSALVCLLPLGLAFAAWSRPDVRNTMLALALLSKVDSSDVAYIDTPGIIRMLINAGVLAVVFAGFRAKVERLALLTAYVAGLTAITFANHLNIDGYSLVRDLITLLLLFGVIGTAASGRSMPVRVESLTWFSLGLLAAELVNLAVFFEAGSEHYLSYDSLKCIVIFASLVALVRGRILLFFALATGTLVVLVGYATRMLLITYVAVLLVLLFSPATDRRGKLGIVASMVGAALLGSVYLSQEFVESSRMFSFFYAVAQAGDWLEYVRVLDPVRYTEHQLFFDRSLWRLAFGDGLGSGFVDSTGVFSFVLPGTGAFSDRELLEARFFRLHDSWIYFGLRLGLVFVLLSFGYFMRAMMSRNRDRALMGALGVLLLNSATFSIAGLFMTGLVAKCVASAGRDAAASESER